MGFNKSTRGKHQTPLTMCALMKLCKLRCSQQVVTGLLSFGMRVHHSQSLWCRLIKLKCSTANGVTSTSRQFYLPLRIRLSSSGMQISLLQASLWANSCMISQYILLSGIQLMNQFSVVAVVTKLRESGIFAAVKMSNESMLTPARSSQWISTNTRIS